MSDPLVIAGKEFKSRLMVGTGRHRSMDEMVASVEAAQAEIITVAIRRLSLDDPREKSILDYFDWEEKYTEMNNWHDSFNISASSQEFLNWLNNEAYK